MNKRLLPWIRKHLPKLKLAVVGVGALALSACATGPNSATANYQNDCADYVGLDQGVFALAKTGVMTYPEIVQFGNIDASVSPLCGPGVNPSSANLAKITAAIATLTAIEAAHGVKP